MACPWYEWSQSVKAAKQSVPPILRARAARASEILKRATLGMHADCATACREGNCSHYTSNCAKCSNSTVLGHGNKGGWCRRPDYQEDCWYRPAANVSPAGLCFNLSFCEGDQQLIDCPVYKAWRPIWLRAFNLWRTLEYRRSNPGVDIARAVGPKPDPSSYLMEDDDTGDPLSAAGLRAEERGDFNTELVWQGEFGS